MPVAVATLVLDIDTVAAAIGALIGKMAEVAVTVAQPLQKVITEWDEYTGRFASSASYGAEGPPDEERK